MIGPTLIEVRYGLKTKVIGQGCKIFNSKKKKKSKEFDWAFFSLTPV